jgi:hypothetical protein
MHGDAEFPQREVRKEVPFDQAFELPFLAHLFLQVMLNR